MVERRWETRKAFRATENESEILRQTITQQVQAPASYSAAWDTIAPGTKQDYDTDLAALAGNSTNGMWARTGSGTGAARTITAGSSISVTNGDGVSGNPTVALAASIDVTDVRTDTLRIDGTPTVAAAVASTHKLEINVNGTTYYILLSNV